MKIIFAPSGYPNEIYPTANSFLQEQAIALAQRGHEVIVLNVAQRGFRKLVGRIDKRIMQSYPCNHIIEYKTWIRTCLQERFPNIYVRKCEKAIRRLFYESIRNQGKPDVIYAHFGFYAGYAMSKIGKEYGIPVVVQEHYSYLMGDQLSSSITRYIQKAIHNSTIYCCVSNNLRKNIINRIHLSTEDKEKLVLLENMLNSKFAYCDVENSNKFVFLSVGNMNSRKNFRLLIEAFCLAFGSKENVELRLGGDGEEYDRLKQLVKEMKREHQIIFLGSLTRDQVFIENKKSNCFALMSKKETFGIVYREALAVGRPIITSNHGGFDYPVDDRDGIQVDSFDAEDVAKAMKTIKNNYASYNLKQISDRCLSQYSEKTIELKIEEILENAIERHKND